MSPSDENAVVITGIGSVLAVGAGREALRQALDRGEPRLSEVDRGAGFHRPGTSRLAALADSVDLSPWLSRRAARRMSQPSKFAVAAARMAIEDAGLSSDALATAETAVVLGTAFGTARFAEALVDDILRKGPDSASPFHFSESVANAPAAQVAISLGARGANVAVTQREASPLLAVAGAAREIALGRSRFALGGATDEVNPLIHAILGRFGALARPQDDGTERAFPLDPNRNGFLAAEGAVVLVLEAEAAARERGATPLARIAATVRAFDPTAPSFGWGRDGSNLAARLREGLARCGQTPESIDLVVSGASGSRAGDSLEAAILDDLFSGTAHPPVTTPKAVVGEYGGGALAAAAIAVGQSGSTGRVLTSALAAGGAAAWILLESP